jgi:uncharacterized protein (TIGR02145 family)
MKETGYLYWYPPNSGATNESGFSALPGGYRGNSGYFDLLDLNAFFWSSTEGSSGSAWGRGLRYNSPQVYHDPYDKRSGVSVRCVMD